MMIDATIMPNKKIKKNACIEFSMCYLNLYKMHKKKFIEYTLNNETLSQQII